MSAPEERLSVEALLAHQGFLAALARQLTGTDQDVDDLVQDAWVASLQGPPPRSRSLKGWLAAVLRNRWRSQVREARERTHRERRVARPEAIEAEQAARGLELRRQVLEAVRSLPEPHLTAIYLRYYEELSIDDVAAATGVPAETARSRIQRGIELLRVKLDREFGARGTWMAAIGGWCRPRSGPDPALPASSPAAALAGPLGWIGGAALAGSVLAVILLTLRSEDPAPVSVVVSRPLDPGEPPQAVALAAPGSRPRAPLLESEPDPAPAPTTAAAASRAAPREDAAAHPVREPSHATTVYEVHGRVLGPRGTPVSGARVHYNKLDTLSDEHGRFELELPVTRFQRGGALLEAEFPLVASHPGHRPAILRDPVARFSQDPSAIQSIELVLGDPPRSLAGRVETVDGRPALGWKVCLRNPSRGIARGLEPEQRQTLETLAAGQPPIQEVDADGGFLLLGLFDRPYDVIAWHPDSLHHVVARSVPGSVSHIVLTGPDPAAARRVAGRVTTLTGAPIGGARIRPRLCVSEEMDSMPPLARVIVHGQAARADDSGYFEFPYGFLDAVGLEVEAEGVLLQPTSFESMPPPQYWENLPVRLPVRCQIVLDARSVAPPADLLAFLNERGERLKIELPPDELDALDGMPFWQAVFLHPGPSRRVVHTRSDAVAALFHDHDGTEIERRPIRPTPEAPTILTW